MYKDGILKISDWYKGMTKHPIFGFGLIQNAEVFENKGIISLRKGLQDASRLSDALPIAEIVDQYGNVYHATSVTGTGLFYKNNEQISTGTLGTIYDIKIYKNYVWIRYETGGTSRLGAYGPLNSSPQFFGSISTGFTTGVWGQLVVGQDDYLYSTNGNYIARIHVDTSGTIGVAPTIAGANTSLTALDLKDGEVATTLCEYGTKLMIGTQSGKVYPWNRQSGTLGNPGLADLPVDFNENGIWQLYSHANKLYVTAGRNGNIYLSDGTNFRKVAQIPFNEMFDNGSGMQRTSPFVSYYPNAITVPEKGTLLIGNVSTNTVAECGVWEILDTGEVCLAYTLSTGKTSSNSIGIGFLRVNKSDNALSVGWYNGSQNGIDRDTTNSTTYYIESPLFRVGTYNNKKTFEHIEFTLTNLMITGKTLTLSYRKNTTDDYTTIGTWTYNSLGSVSSFEDIAGIPDCEFIQLKIEGNVELIDVTLR